MYSAAVLTIIAGPSMGTVAELATPRVVAQAEETLDVSETSIRPEKVQIYIHKLQGSDFSKNPMGIANDDGKKLDLSSLTDKLGTSVSGLSGVKFTYYMLTQEGMKQYKDNKDLLKVTTVEAATRLVNQGLLFEGKTTESTNLAGIVEVELDSKENNKYLFIESEKPKNVSSTVAVPFVVELPFINKNDNSKYLNNVHIYPKNTTGNIPKIDKDVTKLGNDDDSYSIGEEITWLLKSTIPANFKDYKLFEISDSLNKGLSFITDNERTIGKVKFGNDVLTLSEDYTVEVKEKTIKIKLTDKGITKIANSLINKKLIIEDKELFSITENDNDHAFLSIELRAKLDSDAVLGKRIENNVTLNFQNGPDKEIGKETVPGYEIPEVHTGGKRFMKVDAANPNASALANAEFTLYEDKEFNKVVQWTEDLKAANQAAITKGMFNNPELGKPIVLKSTYEGLFEIKGLSYGTKGSKSRKDNIPDTKEGSGSTTYYLKETKAPLNYVVNHRPIPFEVTQVSYNTIQSINLDKNSADATPQEIKNTKRPAIPNTGGIGTAIFIAIGAVVMVFAARGMKGHNKDK